MEAAPDSAIDHNYQHLLTLSKKYPVNCPIAVQIYLDLKKVKLWELLEVRENKELGVIYFSGKVRKEKQGAPEYILPIAAHSNLTMSGMQGIYQRLEGGTLKDLIYGIVDSDSAIAYYRLYNTIVPPTELKLVSQAKSSQSVNEENAS